MTPHETRQELEAVAALAREKGAKRIETACVQALARIEELETALVAKDAAKRAGGKARTAHLSRDQRIHLAKTLAFRRWHPDASTHA